MIKFSFMRGKLDFLVNGEIKSFSELKEQQYCMTHDNFVQLLKDINRDVESGKVDKKCAETVEWQIRKIYTFTFQGELKMKPIEQHKFYKKN